MKGNVLQARQAAYMDGVTVMLAPAAAAEVYKIVIYEITSGKVIISKVSESSTFTTTAAGAICPFFKFTAPAAIVSGSYYAIVLVRTDGTTTTSANVHFPGIAVVAPWDGFVFVDNIRYSGSLAPANGATLTNSGSTGFCHMRMAMRAP